MAAHHLRSLLESFLNILNLEANAEAPIPDSIIPESVSLLPREQLVLPVAMEATVEKADNERQLVFGWANIAVDKSGELVTDAHGEQIELEELELAAYQYVLKFRDAGVNHVGDSVGVLVESMVFTPDKLVAMGLDKDAVAGGWWTGFYIPDPDVFAKVKDGTFKDFSIQGIAEREEVDE